jgi:hypothetical protein
LIII